MVWKVTTPPDAEPVTIESVRRHLRLDSNALDESLLEEIQAARAWVELTCNRALMPQTWQIDLPGFGAGSTLFPSNVRSMNGIIYRGSARSQWTNEPCLLPPNIRTIQSITYYDFQNAQQTLDQSKYVARLNEPAELTPILYWPMTYRRPDAVQIVVDVGYADAGSVPAPIKTAIRLQVQLLIDRPSGQEATALENARDALLMPYTDGRILT